MVLNGTLIRAKMWIGNPLVPLLFGEETTSSIDFTKDTWESTSKKSGAWRRRNSSYKSAELTVEAFVSYIPDAGEVSYAQVFAAYNGTTSIKFSFATGVVGHTEHVGFYHITKVGISAPNEQGATLSLSLTSDGDITSAQTA